MKAVIIQEKGRAGVSEIKEQSMRSDYLKVRTVAVAINPSATLLRQSFLCTSESY